MIIKNYQVLNNGLSGTSFTAIIGRNAGYGGELIKGNPYENINGINTFEFTIPGQGLLRNTGYFELCVQECTIFSYGYGWDSRYKEQAFFISGPLCVAKKVLDIAGENCQERVTIVYHIECCPTISITYETETAKQ